jgi:hypothetical protein
MQEEYRSKHAAIRDGREFVLLSSFTNIQAQPKVRRRADSSSHAPRVNM